MGAGMQLGADDGENGYFLMTESLNSRHIVILNPVLSESNGFSQLLQSATSLSNNRLISGNFSKFCDVSTGKLSSKSILKGNYLF